jgi:cell division protein FtsI/penicillin-binding protein 2
MKAKRSGILRTVATALVVFALIFCVAISFLDHIASVSDEAQTEMVEKAVHNAVLTCYAVEGAYPDDLDYLRENYGLAYDAERYYVTYDAFASNLLPEIYVTEVEADES